MVVARLLPALAQDAAAGQAALGALEPRLGQADEAWVGHRLARGVGGVGGDAHVDPCLRAGGDMLAAPLHLQDELRGGPIRPAEEPHPLDLLMGEGGQLA